MSNFYQDKAAPILDPPERSLSRRNYWRTKIGRRIHQAREAAMGTSSNGMPRMTRTAFGETLGWDERAMWEIENGITPLHAEDLALLGEALNVSPGAFLADGPFSIPRKFNSAGQLSATIARSILELSESERDLVMHLVILLSNRRGQLPYSTQSAT